MTKLQDELLDYLMAEFGEDIPGLALTVDTNLLDEDVLDSLGIFVLIEHLETNYNISIEPEDVVVANFSTVKTIVRLVRSDG